METRSDEAHSVLFVLIGGVENGDLDLIRKRTGTRYKTEWSVPKSVSLGDLASIPHRRT
jgi:hypothetical protein